MSISARNWAWDMGLIKNPETGELIKMRHAQKLVLLFLAEKENSDRGYAYPSLNHIAEKTSLDRSAVKRIIGEFEAAGLVTVHRVKSGNTWMRNTYYLPAVPDEYRYADSKWVTAVERGSHD